MGFTYRPAVLDKTSVLIGIAGPTGCGKTYSALRLATGLAGKGGKIGFIDTENGRALHYARYFNFAHGIIAPPFDPAAYTEAVEAYEKDGFNVIIVDSMTHEYSGEGGIQEWADRLEASGVKSPGNWNEPKAAHKRMVNRFLRCRAHLIFCLRAEEKIKIERVNGKTVVVPMGWKAITEKNFMYEMTASFMLGDQSAGIPNPIKLQDQHKPAFPDGLQISEESGKILAKWSISGEPREESKARTLPLTCHDGTIRVIGKAADWLNGLQKEMDIAPPGLAAQNVWDANADVFYRIETAARERVEKTLIESVNALGKYALSRTVGEQG